MNIAELWKQVFTNSNGYQNSIMGTPCFSGRLSKDKTECQNNILDNDMLHYVAFLEDNNVYKESYLNLTVKPNQPYMVFSTVKIRKVTIKNVTEEKLLKRFNEIKQFIIDNRDNFVDNRNYNV